MLNPQITPAIQQYAEQCEAQRLAQQINDDILSYVEIESDDLEQAEIRFITRGH